MLQQVERVCYEHIQMDVNMVKVSRSSPDLLKEEKVLRLFITKNI